MDTEKYQQFIREIRDKIACWITNPVIEALFASEMYDAESLWDKYRYQVEQIISQQKEIIKNTQERESGRENARWEKTHLFGTQEVRCSGEEEEIVNPPIPGMQYLPGTPNILYLEWSESPSEELNFRIKSSDLTVKDYIVLLGAVHDGLRCHGGGQGQYICPDLRRYDTIVDVLFRRNIWCDSRYKPLIEEAVRVVEKYINEVEYNKLQEKGGLSNGEKIDSPKEKSSRSWLCKLYEKIIKAASDSILDKLNP